MTCSVQASSNYLNEIILEAANDGYNVILRSDFPAKVKKSIQNNDKIILTMKGAVVSEHVNTIYKNTNASDNIIIETNTKDGVKIYINANNITDANIIFNTPNSAPIQIGNKFAREKFLSAISVITFILLLSGYIKSQNQRITKKITVREREIAFYKANMPSINYRAAQQAYAEKPLALLAAEPNTLRHYQNRKT